MDRFTDGVFLLELAPLTESRLVAEAACRLLGAPATGDRPAEDMVVSVLRTRNMLLVLDNCEHVLPGAASLASAILRHCPSMKILATSREALGLPGEGVFPMPSLPVPSSFGILTAAAAMQCDAVRLFTERAADALGSYTLTDADAQAVATICRRLDGVPLATELAAARLRMLKPSEIAARLENVFRLLTGGSRVALPRQQTLRATIDWSFSLLSTAEQIMLRRLSVFVDGCSLDGAVAVAGNDAIDDVEVLDLVSALVAKSLVVADTSGSVTRYRMLETTRQYAAEKLLEAGETNCRRTMASYLVDVFRAAEQTWPTQGTDAWLAAYGPETENLRAAIEWAFRAGEPALGVSLVAHAGAIAEEMTLQADLRRWTEAALPHLTQTTPKTEAATVLYLHSAQQKRLGVYEVPAERHQAIALFRESRDDVGLSRALRQTAVARAMPGEPVPEVLAMLDEAVALLRTRAPHKDLATALAHTGGVYFLYDNHAASRHFNEAALAMREALHDRSGVLASSVNLAELQFLDGDTPGALRYARQAEAEARARSALPTLALILSNTAGYLLQGDDSMAARHAASEALSLSRAIGQDYLAVMCLEHLALALALSGAAEPAAGLLGFTNAHYATSGQTREQLEQAGYDRLLARLAQSLPPEHLAALLQDGATWTQAAADTAALATTSVTAVVIPA
jgi:predicted ATPase